MDKATTDGPFDISATVDTGFELSYEVSGPASVNDNTITLNGTEGEVTVTVSQAGNENYNETSASTSFEVIDQSKA